MNPYRTIKNWKKRQAKLAKLTSDVQQLRKRLEGPASEWKGQQTALLQKVVAHAVDTSPFYRERFKQAGIDPASVHQIADLSSLPILEKTEVRQRRDEIVSTAFPESERVKSMTGGSTAAPLEFYRNHECQQFREINDSLYFDFIGRSPKDRWGLVWGAMRDLGDVDRQNSERYTRWMLNHVVLPGNRMESDSLTTYLKTLNGFGAKFLHGYSQSVWLLARHAQKNGIVTPKLQGVTLTAEPISDEQKMEIEAAFQCPAYSIYGTREFGFIAGECPLRRSMYVNPLNVIVEVLATDGSPARLGENGQVVVTDLRNLAMPLIRYRIGDIAALLPNDESGCRGLPRLEISAGRETDLIVTPDGRYVSGASITLVSSPNIRQLQYRQTEVERLVIRYVPSGPVSDSEFDGLRTKLADVFGTEMQFVFEEVDDIPRSQSGKFVYVYSEVSRQRLAVTSTFLEMTRSVTQAMPNTYPGALQ